MKSPKPEALTDQQRWQRVHDLALDRATALVVKSGQEREARELLVMAGIAKDKLRPVLVMNHWLPEMDKRFCELRKQLVPTLPWYRRWFCR